MGGVSHHDQTDARELGFLHGDVTGLLHGDRASAAIGLKHRECKCFLDHVQIWRGIHLFAVEQSKVHRYTTDAMGIHAPQICPSQGIGHGLSVFGRNSFGHKQGFRKCVQCF